MTGTAEPKSERPGPSELLCRECGVVELLRMEWQRCYPCYMLCETRNYRTYPTLCSGCHQRLH